MEEKKMIWLAGPAGGGWFDLTLALRDALHSSCSEIEIEVLPGGGLGNPLDVQKGRAQLAMTTDVLARAAQVGAPPYMTCMSDIDVLVPNLSTLPFHLLVRTDVPLSKAISSSGFRIGLPPLDTADELTFQRVLSFFNESYASIAERDGTVLHGDYTVIADAFSRGDVDFLFGATTMPAAIIKRIEWQTPTAKLDKLPPRLIDDLESRFGYTRFKIPQSLYPRLSDVDIDTVAIQTVIIASASLSRHVRNLIVDGVNRHLSGS